MSLKANPAATEAIPKMATTSATPNGGERQSQSEQESDDDEDDAEQDAKHPRVAGPAVTVE